MRYWKFFILVFALGCSSEKAAESPKPQQTAGNISVSGNAQQPVADANVEYSLEIIPTAATRNSIINLIPKGVNLSDARITWYVNGSLAPGIVPNQVNQALIKKNDELQAKALIQSKEIQSNIVKIRNTPPELSHVKIMPEVFRPGDALSVEASGNDLDGDEVKILYEWSKNGGPAGNSSRMEGTLRRGDSVAVKITPFDGENYGRPVVLNREILNLPPVISEGRNFTFDGTIYTYQVKASDPDGDSLTYSLKSAPEGMTIDPVTGLIKWNVPAAFKGEAPAAISVTDGHGGEAVYNITVLIGTETMK